ncbi:MAG: hypothetical protein CL920_35995 [Deltaproteobacteria bacterium]|nr:hypothetical protein [Deltaproteobacteria bacterium]MBU54130.1 hypothetical protein [Deltaproteobacteria bacterium]|tara:strand:+ start:19548 stop:21092 length:1545 start_codon:yes stop_codon:yes gene_type:complete
MLQKALENAREVMLLNLGLFLLVSSGFVIKWSFTDDPVRHLTRQLLQKDGEQLVALISHPKVIKAVRDMTAPDPKQPRFDLGRYIADRLLEKDGKLLSGVSNKLLQQPSIQKAIQTLTQPQTPPARSTKPAWVPLAKYATDQLLGNEAELLSKITARVITQLQKLQANAPKQVAPNPFVKLSEKLATQTLKRLLEHDGRLLKSVSTQLITTLQKSSQSAPTKASKGPAPIVEISEKLGKVLFSNLFANDAKLLRVVIRDVLPKPKKGKQAKGKNNRGPITPEVIEKIGKYIVDRTLHARAKPLRAILQELVGAEAMRLVREVRQTVQQVNRQVQSMRIDRLLREVAYETGKGALEGFIQKQSTRERKFARTRRLVERKLPALRGEMKAHMKCIAPARKKWATVEKGALNVFVRYQKSKPKQCPLVRCEQAKGALWTFLTSNKRLSLHPNDVQVTFEPSCQSLREAKEAPTQTSPAPRKVKTKAKGKVPPKSRVTLDVSKSKKTPAVRRPAPRKK